MPFHLSDFRCKMSDFRCNSVTLSITVKVLMAVLVLFFDDLCRYQKSFGTYVPHNKDWLKEKIYIMLRKQAGKV